MKLNTRIEIKVRIQSNKVFTILISTHLLYGTRFPDFVLGLVFCDLSR